jgi:hypothetical protein
MTVPPGEGAAAPEEALPAFGDAYNPGSGCQPRSRGFFPIQASRYTAGQRSPNPWAARFSGLQGPNSTNPFHLESFDFAAEA